MARIHAHPHARLLEAAVWGVPGIALLASVTALWRFGLVADIVAILFSVLAICLIGWGLIPPRKSKPEKATPGRRRRELAEARRQRG